MFAQYDGGMEKGAQTIHERVGGKKDRGGMYAYTYAHAHARTGVKPEVQEMNKNIYKK